MRRYKHFTMTPDGVEHYELGLADDGNFIWLMTRAEPSGTVSHDARGRWRRIGDAVMFEVTLSSSESAPVPTSAILQDDTLELAGFGTFR
jgi:hypothetical protein